VLFFNGNGTSPLPGPAFGIFDDGGLLNKFCSTSCQELTVSTRPNSRCGTWLGMGAWSVGQRIWMHLDNCSLEQKNGIFVNDCRSILSITCLEHRLRSVVPDGGFQGVRFTVIMRGTVTLPDPAPE